ncbi:MAG: lipid A deacylase LpxR family protein [Cyclobacteriaceae bacterium]|nr:lipid A deacylase LpxR family protein [Cyclobacteriaceae bacterium]
MKAAVRYLICGVGHAVLNMFLLIVTPRSVYAQKESMVRIGLDNDFFAYQKEDGAYTNGLMIDYITQQRDSTDIFRASQYSLTQIMITPNSISSTTPPPGDYPYSGSILLSYKTSSIDASEKHISTTSYIVGIMGPYSLAGQTQTTVHKAIHDGLPKGWDSQYGTTVMLNINWSDERGIPNLPRQIAMTGKTEVYVGTIITGAAVQGSIRFGLMNPYFESITGRHVANRQKRMLCYLHSSFKAQAVASNTLLTGNISPNGYSDDKNVRIKHLVYYSELGLDLSYLFLGLSLTYKTHSGLIVGQPTKPYGNVSLTVRI